MWSACFSDAACVNEFQDDCDDDDNDEMHHIVRRSVPNVSFFIVHMIFLLLFYFIFKNGEEVFPSIYSTKYKIEFCVKSHD